jgi:hypothetical protein
MTTKCSAITSANKPCSRDAKINGLCTQHASVKKTSQNYALMNDSSLNKGQTLSIDDNGEYRECVSKKHHIHGSSYPKDKVPIILFRKIPSDSHSLLFKTCLDCRQYQVKIDRRRRTQLKKCAEDQKNIANSVVNSDSLKNINKFFRQFFHWKKLTENIGIWDMIRFLQNGLLN